MTSLFSRLQKLNNMVNDLPWHAARSTEYDLQSIIGSRVTVATYVLPEDAELIVECRNSLPAVLNLIEAARDAQDWMLLPSDVYEHQYKRLSEVRRALRDAVAVFVTPEGDRSTMSGQEEQR